MSDKFYTVDVSKIEPIPNRQQAQQIDDLSYTYTDELGQESIQSLYEFEEESRAHLSNDFSIERDELKATSEFLKSQKKQFAFFETPRKVLWDEFQTGIRNQRNRNTCSAFAMVAAIEARYMRDYSLNLNLSEQFFWHSYKSVGLTYPKHYKYENQSSYWGGGNSLGIKYAANFSIPLEKDCPYVTREEMNRIRQQISEAGHLKWKSDKDLNNVTQQEVDAFEYSPLYISDEARKNARYGVKSYRVLESSIVSSPPSLEKIIAQGHEVIVDARLKWKINITTGIRNYNSQQSGGDHVFLVVGYDRDKKVFYIKNSWGEKGFIRVSYEFARNCFTHGSVVTGVTDPAAPNLKGRAIGIWNMNHDGWKGKLTIRRYTNEKNDVTRLGHYRTSSGKNNAINGKYIDSGRGIQFYISESEDTSPSVKKGQLFILHLYSGDITKAAGHTLWNRTPFGAYISRQLIKSAKKESNFSSAKWKGTWAMNHDGWKSTLVLSNIISPVADIEVVLGEYKPSGGSASLIGGIINTKQAHKLCFDVSDANGNSQPFFLHFHTGSSDLASGFTFWNGSRFGVVAFKTSSSTE